MKSHAISFSTPMLLALREERKSQTRRLGDRYRKIRPGDLLWVREGFFGGIGRDKDKPITFKADAEGDRRSWRPPYALPRAASRLTLTVTEVRTERLQDISARDVVAESIDYEKHKCGCERCATTSTVCPATASSLILEFANLWDSIHGVGAWDENPEIIAISFNVHKCNVDNMPEAA